ncbi:MAG TPA: aminotransferase class V-fold PLP-dependent enzyme [Candidatus Sulfotelmatobacter sp.]|nr:aminotransferase class V-fold PLP-dependent enzyme [Candidatus Sulfotelmatobacter sp.]
MPDWGAWRAEFPLLDRCVYFNACSLGPLPRRGRAALAKYAQDWDEQGTPVWYTTWLPLLERFRAKVGELLNAPGGSTAIAPSVSVALTTLASGLPLPEGRNKVLIGELDFPTIGHQWLSRPEFEVEFVPSKDGMTIPPEAFAERIDSRTALVATTHLFYTTGYLQDVRTIADAAHAKGALCLIDGYQTCGCVPIDVHAMDCDAFVGGCLKWLSGGPGNAFLYVRPELLPKVRPQGTGWFATRDPFSFTLQELTFSDDARRMETGTWAMASHYAGLAGLELILEVGVAAIQERLRDLTDRILERCDEAGVKTFTPRERSRRCGIVTLESDHPEDVESRLHAEGVIVDSRPGRVRLSPHWCVTEEELERGMDLVLQHVGAAAKRPSASPAREPARRSRGRVG